LTVIHYLLILKTEIIPFKQTHLVLIAELIIEDMEYCGEAPDMGAYEYCEEECGAALADVTGDGQIN
tara:strand:- start:310 stop:510 length:201 start_codon:yes stop_codon:yes gene_type:complete